MMLSYILHCVDVLKRFVVQSVDSILVENALLKSAAFFFLAISIFGLLFAFFKMPAILGYMVAGILLGPVLQCIADPHMIEQIKEAGDFGLILLMFVTGLELDISKVVKNGPMKPVSFVGYQLLYTIFTVVYILMLPKFFIANLLIYPIRASILLITISLFFYRYGGKIMQFISIDGFVWKILMILFIVLLFNIKNSFFINIEPRDLQIIILLIILLTFNSTAISIKLLENRDQKETHVGTNVISVLIVQDLVFIVALIILKSFGSNINFISIAIKVGLAIVILLCVNLLSKAKNTLLSFFLDYIRKTSSELLTIVMITFCLICASISDACGLSDIYGAFIAGLLLGNVYKHRHNILVLCQPISTMLISVFFVYIGIIINLDVLFQYFPLIILINTLIFITKYFINYRANTLVNQGNEQFSNNCIAISSLTLTQMSEFSTMLISVVLSNILPYLSTVQYLGISEDNLKLFFAILESSSLVSLTLGCLVTVLLKRILYRRKNDNSNMSNV